MFAITLEVNQICNLMCTYCYLGKKLGQKMSKETAFQAIDYAYEKVRVHKDRKLWFDFVGGEPLISFDFIQELVEYIENRNKEQNYYLLFSFITNATLLNKEIIDYCIEKRIQLKISLDGKKEINDKNRISGEGYSVHDRVIKNLDLLRNYEEKTKMFVQVTNVITKNNYMCYYDTVVYLIETLKLKVIDTGIDIYTEWNKDEIEVIQKQIEKCFAYFMESCQNGKYFGWSILDEILDSVEPNAKFYSCGAGIVSLYVRTDGSYYACAGCLKEEMCLGNVKTGVLMEKKNYLKNLNGIENEECNVCKYYTNCNIKGCIMCSFGRNGDINKPVKIMCSLQKFYARLYYENLNFIKQIIKGEGNV